MKVCIVKKKNISSTLSVLELQKCCQFVPDDHAKEEGDVVPSSA